MNLKALILCLCPLSSMAVDTVSNHSPLRLGDSISSVACEYYNRVGLLTWKKKGGDWIDAEGTMHGTVPFATASVELGQTSVTVDVPGTLLNTTGILVQTTGSLTVSSREAGNPSTLTVQTEDGPITVPARADATITCSTGKGQGTLATVKLDRFGAKGVFSFPPVPDPMGTATLTLPLTNVSSPGEVQLYAVVAPLTDPGEPTGGFAAEYPHDIGIDTDPRVLYAENWDSDHHNFWKRNADQDRHTAANNDLWKYDLEPCPEGANFCPPGSMSGVFRDGRHNLAADDDGGVYGGKLHIKFPPERTELGNGTKTPHGELLRKYGKEFDEVYYRYYLKFGPTFRDAPRCDGGKLPGFVSEISGGLVADVTGKNGWSLRGGYDINCDRQNPTYPRVALTTYAYDMSKPDGQYGQSWAWTGRGELGLVELDRWVCVEQRLKVNTPGQKDGIMQVWLDGVLAHERYDVQLRGFPPYEPKLAKTLGISEAANHTHHGGKMPAGKWMDLYMDQLVVATERVGCMTEPSEDPQVEPAAE